ncbi:hypothetical protein Tco_0832845 [Tanacetum coccineum]
MSTPKFTKTHNLVAFLDKPEESEGFEKIIDFLNASSIRYALTIQALVDRKKVIVIETSVRQALHLKDAKGTNCLPTTTIFAKLERMGYENLSQKLNFYKAFFSPQWKFLIHTILQCLSAKTTAWNEFSSTMASAITCLAINQIFNFSMYIFNNMVKNLEGGVKFLMYPSSPTKHITDEATNEEHVSTPSYDPSQSGEDRMQPNELMDLCAKLSDRVLTLENTNTSQAAEIATLKERFKKLEKKRRSKTYKPRRLYKVGLSRRIESSDDASLGAQDDASKQGRKIADLDADTEVNLIDETQGRNDEDLMFDTGVLNGDEVFQEPMVNTATTTSSIPVSAADPVTTAGEVVTTASVEIPKELTLDQTLIEIKSAKPKAVTTATTTVTLASSRRKAKGIVFHDQEEHAPASIPIVSPSQIPQAKDKGKAKMVKPEKPLKKKDQIAINEEVARNLEAQLQDELEEEERLLRQKEEEANIALIESWDNTQAMMDAAFQLAQQMQTGEQEQLSIEEKSKLFIELLEKRNKHFAALKAQEKRNKPPTKAQKRNTMSTYFKNMVGYKHNQLKSKSYDEIQEMFDKEMKRVNTFVDMNTELVKGSKTKAEGSSKRAGEELKSDNSKKQRIDEHVEAKGDDDQEEAEMKKHMEIVKDDEVAIDVIPLATKPPVIVEWKIVKEGKMGYFHLIRANGSSKRYSSMIQMLQRIDREDLETLWKLDKAKHGITRLEEAYETVLRGDLKVMFEPDIKSKVWRSLEGHNVTVWKLFSSSGVHFVD